jgi:hypothetical protein
VDKDIFLATVEELYLAGKDDDLRRLLEQAPPEVRDGLSEGERAFLSRAAEATAMAADAARPRVAIGDPTP